MNDINCIFLAAGIGNRTGEKNPKQLTRTVGKPLLIYPLETLVESGFFNRIITTYPRNFLSEYKEIISKHGLAKKIVYVEGGETRQESVYKALKFVETDRVAIHESSRPLLSMSLLKRVLFSNADCVTPVLNVPSTVVGGYEVMTKTFKRAELKYVQFPQVFNTQVLKTAHEKARKENLHFTEDSSLVFHYGNGVQFVEGERLSIKVVTQEDIFLIKCIIEKSPSAFITNQV